MRGAGILKHRSGEAVLQRASKSLAEIAHHALSDADLDSDAFRSFIHAKSRAAAEQLVCTGEKLAHLIRALTAVIEEVEACIEPSVAGDLLAARVLAGAAHSIQTHNESEARQEQASTGRP